MSRRGAKWSVGIVSSLVCALSASGCGSIAKEPARVQPCDGGTCVGVVGGCSEGTYQCLGPQLQRCNATGHWQPDGAACSGSTPLCDTPTAGCAPGCTIGGATLPQGAPNPVDTCQSCQSSDSAVAWTNATNGTACGNGQVCANGQCGTQCVIAGARYPTSAVNPANTCQTCQPGTSTGAWTDLASGALCGATGVCHAGVCDTGCLIGTTLYPPDAVNPANPTCQICQPAMSTSAWSASASDGSPCGAGMFCTGGSCEVGCYIAGTYYAASAPNPASVVCQSCQPSVSASAWSTAAVDGTGCGAGDVCIVGSCIAGCYIDGAYVAPGTMASSGCETCTPTASTSSWDNAIDGVDCGGVGEVCYSGACSVGAYNYFVGSGASGLVFDGTNIWVVNNGTNDVTKLVASTGALVGTYPAGMRPFGITFDGTNIWVGNQSSDTVTKLLASTGAVLGTYPVGTYPMGLAFDGANVWVANQASGTATKLLASSGELIGTYQVGSQPVAMAFDGTNIWITNEGVQTLTKVLASTGAVVGTYGVGANPTSVTVAGPNIWVANFSDNTVTELVEDTGAVVGTYPVVGGSAALTYDGTDIWVATAGERTLVQLSASTGATLATHNIPSGDLSGGILFDGTNIWLTDFGGNIVIKFHD